MEALIEHLRRRRTEMNVSLRQLARELGVSHAAIQAWESERAAPPVARLAAWASALGLTLDMTLRTGEQGGTDFVSPGLTESQRALLDEVLETLPLVDDERAQVLHLVLRGIRAESGGA